ncbi:ABC transporter ATP-binding protein [Fundicoccus culcitae]|uniref:ABC transporter ATP-binding protein/permease n=1 Tax=Fundicoccus culcitae TaxID=2969821 RepID=A0ABY5P7M6_9LACT|nr:ABC transporter ATP-binding protein [Fundicoccus culcitae]UUX34408.1 ABC transporter ATP-binding protein/permease [Fundicoccus culcitae]
MRNSPKKLNRLHLLKRLWSYLFHYKWMLLTAILLNIASNLFLLVGPLLSGYAIDAIQLGVGQVQFERVFLLCFYMLVFYLMSSILEYIMSVLMTRLTQKTVRNMRSDLFTKLTRLPVGYFDTHAVGDILSRITYDIDTINTSLSSDFIQVLSSIITIVGSVIMMILISPNLMLVFVVTIPMSILLTKYMTDKFQPLFRQRSAKLGELNGFVEENISGQQTIKVYHQEVTMIESFDALNKQAVDAYYQSEYYGSMVGPSVTFINNLSLSLISVYGAFLYLWGNITLGNLSSFVLYSRRFSGPINEISNIFGELQSAFAAAERVFQLLDEAEEVADIDGAYVFKDVKGDVDFENVTFAYTDEKPIIKHLSLSVKAGDTIAIVGPTGAGKTTLINLLMRFYDPQSGIIRLDGIDIKTATRSSLRLAYAMVLQDTWLFKGTIYDNLTYGSEDASQADVEAAAKAAMIHSYIMSLPQGYQTMIDEDGQSISQGQKQLLTIARAMLLDAQLLILDEATSNVDTTTELKIQEAMNRLMKGKTSFVIAHRLSTIQHADNILVVNHGEIVEQGTHEELLAADGLYNTLYHSQFDKS